MTDKKVDPKVGEAVVVSASGDFDRGTRAIVMGFDKSSCIVTVKDESGSRNVPKGQIRKVLHG